MAINTQRPKDAILLNENEASVYAWNLINSWNALSETWALRYSSGILGGLSSAAAFLINRHYREKLKLGSYGHFSSLLPIVVLSGSLTALFHKYTVSTSILVMNREKVKCPICYEIRSATIQCGFGVVYPMILAPISGFMFASRYSTYRVPDIVGKPMELFQLWKKITKSLHGTLGYIVAVHLVMSSLLTYYQLKNNFTIKRQILEIEKQIDSGFDKES